MQADPIQEWQRLTEHYRQMGDQELRELAFDFSNLTDTAQQALRHEMHNRALGDPQVANEAPQPLSRPQTTAAPIRDRTVDALSYFGRQPELVPDMPETDADEAASHEYTWKTLLCTCETSLEARQLSEALKQAGIESWIEGPKSSAYSGYAGSDLINPRVLVPADQLDQARAIAAKPIPQEIVQACAMQLPDFTPPKCPNCGAEDPVLEAIDSVNRWRCEQCDKEWMESAGSGDETARATGENPL